MVGAVAWAYFLAIYGLVLIGLRGLGGASISAQGVPFLTRIAASAGFGAVLGWIGWTGDRGALSLGWKKLPGLLTGGLLGGLVGAGFQRIADWVDWVSLNLTGTGILCGMFAGAYGWDWGKWPVVVWKAKSPERGA
jgi:hypothetical protein